MAISHKYGSTAVPANPQRVVSLDGKHDELLALGVTPIATSAAQPFNDQPFGVYPWAQDELGDVKPEVLPLREFDLERIAALDPDLLIGVVPYSGMTREQYDDLSASPRPSRRRWRTTSPCRGRRSNG